MTCEATKPLLPAWHFAELDPPARADVEAHLVGCSTCVQEFVALKRAIELAEAGPRPSATARAALRDAVSLELGLRWRWWERPLALGVAAASVVFAVFVLGLR